MSEPSAGGVGTAQPELCRVSVIGGNTQLDVGLPATVPVASFITDVVELIESRNPDLTESDEGPTPLKSEHWTLARLGRDPIPPNQSLTEAEVHDGELLVLRSVTAKELPALFDDVIDAVSELVSATFSGWSAPAARWMGLVAALCAVIGSIVVSVVAKAQGVGFWIGFLPLLAGILAETAAVIAYRRYRVEAVSVLLSLDALLLLFAAGVLLVPGKPGSPGLMVGCVVALVFSAIAYNLTRVGAIVFVAAALLGVFGGVAAFLRMIFDFDTAGIGAGVLVAVLVSITLAPRLSVFGARLPVPPVPTAGAAIDPADHEPRPTIADLGVVGATALPSAAGLERRAKTANEYQSGVVIGTTIAAVVASFLAAAPLGSVRWPGVALATVMALIMSLRGRAFADVVQASVLIGGGAATAIALVVGLALGSPTLPVYLAAVLLVIAGLVMFFGVIGPNLEVSPVVRRAGEVFEYALIVAVVPLVLWTMDVYSAARNM